MDLGTWGLGEVMEMERSQSSGDGGGREDGGGRVKTSLLQTPRHRDRAQLIFLLLEFLPAIIFSLHKAYSDRAYSL